MLEPGNLIALLGFLAAAVGLGFAGWELHRTRTTQRGQFFKELYEPFFTDPRLRYAYSLMEAHENIFSRDFGARERIEAQRRQEAVESLLARFEVICDLYRRKLLTDEDLGYFEFNMKRVYNYPGFRRYYLPLLEEYAEIRKLDQRPYDSFLTYIDQKQASLEVPGAYPEWFSPRWRTRD